MDFGHMSTKGNDKWEAKKDEKERRIRQTCNWVTFANLGEGSRKLMVDDFIANLICMQKTISRKTT